MCETFENKLIPALTSLNFVIYLKPVLNKFSVIHLAQPFDQTLNQ